MQKKNLVGYLTPVFDGNEIKFLLKGSKGDIKLIINPDSERKLLSYIDEELVFEGELKPKEGAFAVRRFRHV